MKTWHFEMLTVALALVAVAIATGSRPVEWIGSAAVLAGFGHATIADRLAEREAARAKPEVECHAKLVRYFGAKEVLWAAYFIATHCWSALVGCGVFIAYPFWRRAWRHRFPLVRTR